MQRWLRRLRGIAGTGAIWGAAGIALGTVAAPFVSVYGGLSLLEALLQVGLSGGLAGFLLGSGFATVLTTLEGRRTFHELTSGRAAVCGAVAGAAYPLVVLSVFFLVGGPMPALTENLVPLLVGASVSYGLLTAGLAAGTLSLAHRAPAELGSGRQTDGLELLGDVSEGWAGGLGWAARWGAALDLGLLSAAP